MLRCVLRVFGYHGNLVPECELSRFFLLFRPRTSTFDRFLVHSFDRVASLSHRAFTVVCNTSTASRGSSATAVVTKAPDTRAVTTGVVFLSRRRKNRALFDGRRDGTPDTRPVVTAVITVVTTAAKKQQLPSRRPSGQSVRTGRQDRPS